MIPAIQVPRLVRWAAMMAAAFLSVLTLMRFIAYLSFREMGVAVGNALGAFCLGVRYDTRVVAVMLLPLVTIGALRACSPFAGAGRRRGWIGFFALCTLALVVLYVSDFLHLRYLHQRLNASALGFLEDARISAGMVWQSYPVLRIAAGLLLAVVALVAWVVLSHGRVARSDTAVSRAARIGWHTAAIVACVLGAFGRVGQYPLRWSDAFRLQNDAAAQLALNPAESFFSSLSFRGSGYDASLTREHYPRMRQYLGVPDSSRDELTFRREVPARTRGAAAPNVVLVLCESFSGYKSSMWGNPLDPTPFFAQLCREGVFFDNCFTPHFGTARGVWATITGIPDVEPRKTASRNPALVDQHTIVNDFTDHEKLYFLGGSTSWANVRGLLTNNIRGLRLYEEDSYRSRRVDVWGISDKSLFLEANEILRAQTKPFFAVIQTAGNHRPYTIPDEDLAEFRKLELTAEELRRGGFESNAEFNAFRYTDYTFQCFLREARKSPYFDHTVFVFIGDHGIGGTAGPPFPAAWTDRNLTCYHVPLLFYAPKLLAPQRIHSVASMVDVLPTVAGIAGIAHTNSGLGRDLLRQQAIDGGRSNVAFIVDQHTKAAGVVQGSHFYTLQRESRREDLVWADFAAAETPPPDGAALRAELTGAAAAFYETARFMLFHNPKPANAETGVARGGGLSKPYPGSTTPAPAHVNASRPLR